MKWSFWVGATAVDKTLDLLDLLIKHPNGLRAMELSRETSFPPGTLHRLLGMLVRRGFVQQEPTTERYLLGHKFPQAFSAMVRATGLQETALPHLKSLANSMGQAANLGVLRGDQLVFLESIVADSAGPIMYSPPGTLAPPHCTAMGKVLLAYLPAADLQRYFQRASPLAARTSKSLTSVDAAMKECDRVRQTGYACNDEEYHTGFRCVAAPVRDHSGQAVAAISVSMPVATFPPHRIPSIANHVMQTARAMSVELGYVPATPEPTREVSRATTRRQRTPTPA